MIHQQKVCESENVTTKTSTTNAMSHFPVAVSYFKCKDIFMPGNETF